MSCRNADKDLLVSEIFGPTFQGEGPSAGQRAVFLRLSRCQLTCAWCDTPYTWDTGRYDLAAETRRMSQSQVLDELMARPAPLVVISGGEPLLQQDRLTWLIDVCRARRRRVEIETNGAVVPGRGVLGAAHRFNVSPKLANSGMPAERRINPVALRTLAKSRKAVFKFVVDGPGDLDEIADLEAEHELAPIWVMPLGTTYDQVLNGARAVAGQVLARGWNLTIRLHVLLWGDVRIQCRIAGFPKQIIRHPVEGRALVLIAQVVPEPGGEPGRLTGSRGDPVPQELRMSLLEQRHKEPQVGFYRHKHLRRGQLVVETALPLGDLLQAIDHPCRHGRPTNGCLRQAAPIDKRFGSTGGTVPSSLACMTLGGLFTYHRRELTDQAPTGGESPFAGGYQFFGRGDLRALDGPKMLPGVAGELTELHQRQTALCSQPAQLPAEPGERRRRRSQRLGRPARPTPRSRLTRRCH